MVAQVTKTDNRTIARLAKDIATMRRRVASAVRKHNSLKARLSRLANADRIVWLHKDAEIVAGEGLWYVKAESLNTDKDAEWNWYYQVLFIEEYGVYQCSCEDVRQCDCKHAVALGASFEQAPAATAAKRVLSDESFEYLGTQLRHVEEEQEDGTIITWSLKPDGTRKKIAQTWPLKQQAAKRERYNMAFDPCLVA